VAKKSVALEVIIQDLWVMEAEDAEDAEDAEGVNETHIIYNNDSFAVL
jgi:hypothetical protein